MTAPDNGPIRKELRRFEVEGHARFITCSTARRLPVFANESAADRFAERLETVRQTLEFRLFAWVLMPDHFHLLVLPNLQVATMPRILHSLKRPIAERLLREGLVERNPAGPTKIWEPGGGFDRNVFSDKELREKGRYIELNPVRNGLALRSEEWRWSSAATRNGMQATAVRIDPFPR